MGKTKSASEAAEFRGCVCIYIIYTRYTYIYIIYWQPSRSGKAWKTNPGKFVENSWKNRAKEKRSHSWAISNGLHGSLKSEIIKWDFLKPVLLLLRETIVNRTYGIHKKQHI